MQYGIEISIIFILGLIIGSFSNVCIFRIPKNESIVFPASHCPNCHTPIKAIDNIPILSFLLLKGKCRKCGEKISIRYPVVEFLTGAIYLLIFLSYGRNLQTLIYALLSSSLIIISFIDLDEQIIPDEISLPGIIIGFALSFIVPYISYLNSILGIIAGGGIILLIALVGLAIFKKEAMGGGDVKLSAMIGAFIGWKYIMISLFIGFFIGAIAGILLILLKIRNRDDLVPFGPFIVLGSFITLLWGENILSWYLGF
jgi:leader peptidase (prepilin peptidase)/N-methyltransferase